MRDLSFQFGSGPVAVVLVHGLTGTPVEIRGVGKSLAAAGYAVYGVQLAGHCGSEADLIATTWQDWYRSVTDVLAQARRRHRHVVVGGLCMGALLAIKAAAEHRQDVDAVLLYSTPFVSDGWAMPRHQWMLPLGLRLGLWRWWRFEEKPPYGIKDDRIRERLVTAMMAGDSGAAGNMATPGAAVRQLHRLIRSARDAVPKVSCPALVVHAAEDDIASRRNADWLAARLSGDVTKVILTDSYHMVTLDRDRDRLIEESASFLARLPREAGRSHLRVVANRGETV